VVINENRIKQDKALNIKDMFALDELQLRKNHLTGLTLLLQQLSESREEMIRQVLFVTDLGSYMVITTASMDKLIGCYKDPRPDTTIYLDYQKRLKQAGYTNERVYLIENGVIKGSIVSLRSMI
jgi:hypothetical protein